MNRQVKLALATVTLTVTVTAGLAAGQTPPPAAAGPVYVMKTAGQPERRVQVLKSETQPDGTILTDVKDLGTGTVYTLTNPAFLGKPAPATVAIAPKPIAAPPAIAPGTPRPLFGQFPNQRAANAVQRAPMTEHLVPVPSTSTNDLPHARSRTNDPLLAGATATPAAIAARTPFPSRAPFPTSRTPVSPPNVMEKVFGDPLKNQPPPRVGVQPTTQGIAHAPSYGTVPATVATPAAAKPIRSEPFAPKPAVAALPMPKVAKPVDASAGLAIPTIDANAKPSAATGLFDSQASTAGVVLPTISEPAAAPKAIPMPAVSLPTSAVPAAVAEPTIPLPRTAESAVAVTAPVPATSASGEPPRDVKLMIEDIKTHRRPSFRMENATALAESAYAKHPAAIEALLHAAANDKAGVVRGHCIARLSDLGYSDPTYLKLLDAWSNDLEPAVQRAAADAKAKLGR